MFESIVDQPPSRFPTLRRIGPWILIVGLPTVGILMLSARAQRPGVALLILGMVLWLPMLGATLGLARRISEKSTRVIVQAFSCVLFLTPSIVAGEGGVAPAPAVVVLFVPGHFAMGLVPLGVVAIFVTAILVGRGPIR